MDRFQILRGEEPAPLTAEEIREPPAQTGLMSDDPESMGPGYSGVSGDGESMGPGYSGVSGDGGPIMSFKKYQRNLPKFLRVKHG